MASFYFLKDRKGSLWTDQGHSAVFLCLFFNALVFLCLGEKDVNVAVFLKTEETTVSLKKIKTELSAKHRARCQRCS